jgi:hypothetical protein
MFYKSISKIKKKNETIISQPKITNPTDLRIGFIQSSLLITYYLLVLLHHAINPEINNAGIPIIGQAKIIIIKRIIPKIFIFNDL